MHFKIKLQASKLDKHNKNYTFWINTLLKIWALTIDITFSHTVFIFITKMTVKIGSRAYSSPTLLSSFQSGSGLAPISTSKNLPTKNQPDIVRYFVEKFIKT